LKRLRDTHCGAGSLCSPPLNLGGITVYVAFARSPKNRFNAPAVPAWAEATKPDNAQHSRIELPFDAEIAVRFNAGGTKDEADAGQAEEVADWALAMRDESASAASVEKTWV
jgi:hypothetical protein